MVVTVVTYGYIQYIIINITGRDYNNNTLIITLLSYVGRSITDLRRPVTITYILVIEWITFHLIVE